jgi:hypothetical protein
MGKLTGVANRIIQPRQASSAAVKERRCQNMSSS